MKNETFFKGIFSLIISQFFVKILGLIYSVYLINKSCFGDTGNAVYIGGYQVYSLILAVCSIGIPNALSKIISEKFAVDDIKNLNKNFKVGIITFSSIGFVLSFLLYFEARNISIYILDIKEAEFVIKALSPAIFFVAFSSVLKGYFNGIQKISITAKAQTLEQMLKCFFTILFFEISLKLKINEIYKLSAIVAFSTTLSAFFSTLYLCIIFHLNKIKKIGKNFKETSVKNNLKKIFNISLPISFCSVLSGFSKNIDSVTIVRILKDKVGEGLAKEKYGMICSKVDTFTALPLSFNIAFSTALIPEISKSLIKNDFENIKNKIEYSVTITSLIAFPCMFAFLFFPQEILKLLFPRNYTGYELLRISSVGIVFSCLTQTINGVLQGIGKNNVLIKSLLGGIIVKFFCNIWLLPIKEIYEKGAVIGNVCSQIVSFIVSYETFKKSIDIKIPFLKCIFKPFLVSFISIFSTNIFYIISKESYANEKMLIIFTIFLTILLFFIFIYIFRIEIFKKEKIK